MKNDIIQKFSYSGNLVRTILKNGQAWFVAKDVCNILEHSNSRMAVERLDCDEKGVSKVYTLGGKQEMTVINESGLYSLVLTSNKPEAKQFKRWITHEVIPSIRETGQYSVTQSLPSNFADACRMLADEWEQKQKLLPKAEQFDKFISGENYQDMNTVAKSIGWGRNKLFKELRQQRILMSDNKPYQQYIDRGYFVVKEKPIDMGCQVINKVQTYVTPKGVDYISKLVS